MSLIFISDTGMGPRQCEFVGLLKTTFCRSECLTEAGAAEVAQVQSS